MNRKETTKFLTDLLIHDRLSDRKYYAKEVTLDYGTIQPKRIDVMEFRPKGVVYASDMEKESSYATRLSRATRMSIPDTDSTLSERKITSQPQWIPTRSSKKISGMGSCKSTSPIYGRESLPSVRQASTGVKVEPLRQILLKNLRYRRMHKVIRQCRYLQFSFLSSCPFIYGHLTDR